MPFKRRNETNKPSYSTSDFQFNIRNYMNYSTFVILVSTILFFIAGVYYAFFMTPIYQSTAYVENQPYDSAGGLSQSRKLDPLPLDVPDPNRDLQLINAPVVVNEVIDKMIQSKLSNTKDKKSIDVNKETTRLQNIISNVQITIPALQSAFILVQLKGQDAKETTDIVNSMVEVAARRSEERNHKQLNDMEISLQNTLAATSATINDLQKQSNLLKSKNGDVNTQLVSTALLNQLTTLNNAIDTIEQQMAAALLINTNKSLLYQQLAASYDAMTKQALNLEKKIGALPQLDEETAYFDRAIANYTLAEQTLIEQISLLQSIKDTTVGDLRILEYSPVPTMPVSYSRLVIILLSIVFGLLIGYVLAIVLD